MLPHNVKSILVHGEDVDYNLFQIAIQFAEIGKHVWFVSPEPFEILPTGINVPEREILKLITFLYLKKHSDLLSQLNSIHGWHRLPQVIIINDLDNYIQPDKEDLDSSAFVLASLLDAAQACANKHASNSHVLASARLPENGEKLAFLQKLVDLYFGQVVSVFDRDSFVMLNELIN